MPPLAWFLLAFFSGSVPFSPLLGRLALGRDIRQYGDGNPGSTNVFKAGGRWAGAAALLLDGFKGAIPVGLAYWGAGLTGGWLLAVALAPVLGHAFSPFLAGRGGKAVATTFGVWAGLTGPEAPVVLGFLLAAWFLAVENSGWALLFTWLSFLGHLLFYRPEAVWLGLWALNGLLLAWKYRADLTRRPRLRTERAARLLRRLGRAAPPAQG
jgi:glycerol-3-phosphate acyltransferase PlsY